MSRWVVVAKQSGTLGCEQAGGRDHYRKSPASSLLGNVRWPCGRMLHTLLSSRFRVARAVKHWLGYAVVARRSAACANSLASDFVTSFDLGCRVNWQGPRSGEAVGASAGHHRRAALCRRGAGTCRETRCAGSAGEPAQRLGRAACWRACKSAARLCRMLSWVVRGTPESFNSAQTFRRGVFRADRDHSPLLGPRHTRLEGAADNCRARAGKSDAFGTDEPTTLRRT